MKPRYHWRGDVYNKHYELGVWVLNDECFGKCGKPVSVFLDPPAIPLDSLDKLQAQAQEHMATPTLWPHQHQRIFELASALR